MVIGQTKSTDFNDWYRYHGENLVPCTSGEFGTNALGASSMSANTALNGQHFHHSSMSPHEANTSPDFVASARQQVVDIRHILRSFYHAHRQSSTTDLLCTSPYIDRNTTLKSSWCKSNGPRSRNVPIPGHVSILQLLDLDLVRPVAVNRGFTRASSRFDQGEATEQNYHGEATFGSLTSIQGSPSRPSTLGNRGSALIAATFPDSKLSACSPATMLIYFPGQLDFNSFLTFTHMTLKFRLQRS